jgi:hypothetical protein
VISTIIVPGSVIPGTGVMGLLAIAALIVLLAELEIVATARPRLAVTRRALPIAIAGLLVVFAMIVVTRLAAML